MISGNADCPGCDTRFVNFGFEVCENNETTCYFPAWNFACTGEFFGASAFSFLFSRKPMVRFTGTLQQTELPNEDNLEVYVSTFFNQWSPI